MYFYEMAKRTKSTLSLLIKDVEAWWDRGRWRNVQRDWCAENIVRLRGSQPLNEPASNAMAQKFWEQMEHAKANKCCKSSFGALDAVQVVQMAKYLDTVYVSGWQSSSTASSNNLCGPDLADYPMDTVPRKVDQLFRAQQFHDRKQFAAGGTIDYMNPIIADADTGHGGVTAVMKLTQMMVEAGAAGIHLEDQRAGAKKCGHMGGQVLCSTREHIARLKAARVQTDIMGTDTILIARTDAKSAMLLDNDIDEVDRPYILGRSPWSDTPVTERKSIDLAWKNNSQKRHWVPLRTSEGYYRIEGGLPLAIDRAVAFAPYADMLWCELDTSSLEDAKIFADGVLSRYPSAKLAINNSPSFNWSTSGLDDEELRTYHDSLGEMGYVWSFITLAGFHVDGLSIDRFARDFAQNSMLAYTREIQDKEREEGVELLTHQKWSGSELIDLQMQTVMGDYSTATLGADCTETQF
jgi:isocitrate lyase